MHKNLREGFKKKEIIVKNSTKQGEGSRPDFPLRNKKKQNKKHGLKTLDVALGSF